MLVISVDATKIKIKNTYLEQNYIKLFSVVINSRVLHRASIAVFGGVTFRKDESTLELFSWQLCTMYLVLMGMGFRGPTVDRLKENSHCSFP